MKKFILFALFGMLAFACNAQVTNMVSGYGNPTDTVTNAGSNYVYITSPNPWQNISVQPVITKISGTVAGTYYLQGSLDNTNWVSVVGDSATATNVTTNTRIWKESTKAYKYYRIGYTGSGTMAATLRGYFFTNNP